MHGLSDQGVCAFTSAERFNRALNADTHVRNLEFRILVLGVSAHAVDDFACTCALFHDFLEHFGKHLRIKRPALGTAQKAVRKVRDRAQGLLQFVGNHCGHLPDDTGALKVGDMVAPAFRCGFCQPSLP